MRKRGSARERVRERVCVRERVRDSVRAREREREREREEVRLGDASIRKIHDYKELSQSPTSRLHYSFREVMSKFVFFRLRTW